jgi:DNA-binding NarL/FixJ family response regulator
MGARANDNATREPLTAPRVIIADDDPLVRRVIRDVLETAGVRVVAQAPDGHETVRLALQVRPEVVVLDLALPETGGLQAIRLITEAAPEVRILALSRVHDDDAAIAGLRAGASGYVTKDTDLDALPRIVRAIAAGEVAISRAFAAVVLDRLRSAPLGNAGLRPVRSLLTAREWEVLDLLCTGLGTDDIAHRLVLSTETIRSHLKRAMRKLGVNNRAAAIEAAARLRGSAAGHDAPLAA